VKKKKETSGTGAAASLARDGVIAVVAVTGTLVAGHAVMIGTTGTVDVTCFHVLDCQ